jgi:nicotinamidase-related amidase
MSTFPSIGFVIVDPQSDFHPGGSLAVSGADDDAQRYADLLRHIVPMVSEVFVTLDTHPRIHIAHAICWKDKDGNSPPIFTKITNKDILDGTWTPSNLQFREHALSYTEQLEAQGRFTLTIWPEHCLLGTPGHAVVPVVNDAIQAWAGLHIKEVQYVLKGMNPLTEMYSAVRAEVPITSDPSTSTNHDFLSKIIAMDKLIVCGQALSHCVNFTLRDILQHWVSLGKNPADIYLLADGSSPVAGCEADAIQFVADMRTAGVTIATTVDIIGLLAQK